MKKYLLLILSISYFLAEAQLTPTQPMQEINAFTSVVADGQLIIASTDKNKIVKSTDGGTTWLTVTGNVPAGINKLYSPAPSLIFACGNGGAMTKSSDFGDTWSPVNSGTTVDLLDFTSINSSILFACGKAGKIIKSTDGGSSWTAMNPTQFNINSIKFASQQTGWAACDNGIILRTLDAGATWARVPGASAPCDFGVITLHGLDGIFVFGREGQVVASTNGGIDWKYGDETYYMKGDTVIAAWNYGRDTVVYADDRGALSMVIMKPDRLGFDRFGDQAPLEARYNAAFRTADKMFFVAGSGPNLSKAYGSGNNWTPLILLLKGKNLRLLKFAGDKVGIVSDFDAQYYYSESDVFVTTDAGANWRFAKRGTRLRSLQALSPEKLYITELSAWMSRDSGKVWTTKTNIDGYFRDMLFLDSLNGYCLSYYLYPTPPGLPRGRLYKTNDGGYTWSQLQIFESWSVWDIYADKTGRMWISQGAYGDILVSNNGGTGLSSSYVSTNAMPVGANIGERGYMAFGDGKIAFSSSGGFGFTLKYDQPGITLNAASNSIDGKSLVVGNGGKMLATTNDGESWQEINLGTSSDFTAVALMSDLSYIVCTGSGEVFKGERPFIFTDVKDETANSEMPVAFTLGNYPNPFNGSTVIHFTLPEDFNCRLEVFSSLGSLIFSNDIKGSKGENRFNFDAAGLESGVYFYRVKAGGKVLTGKMVLLK
ncbi:MAG: T9SS type A sorting domain-containing protein [Bacteroidetes bacterium]|nr:T9SS type A sorting domain-containing protein [Bacteroidota bacterium]